MDGFWGDVVKIILGGALGAGGLGAVLAYFKDRRLNNAKGDVAVQTVELQVDFTRMQNLESRFALAERAWDEERESLREERESLTRRVAAAEARELALEKALAERDKKIRDLEARVGRVQSELVEVTRELADLRSDQR